MNSVLIDTHILLWWLTNPQKLKSKHLKLIEDSKIDIEVSMSSLFEITIKRSVGKLSFDLDLKKIIFDQGFKLLNINYAHLDQYLLLPLIHKDPFDRIIIAQAISENIPVISYDKFFSAYDITLL